MEARTTAPGARTLGENLLSAPLSIRHGMPRPWPRVRKRVAVPRLPRTRAGGRTIAASVSGKAPQVWPIRTRRGSTPGVPRAASGERHPRRDNARGCDAARPRSAGDRRKRGRPAPRRGAEPVARRPTPHAGGRPPSTPPERPRQDPLGPEGEAAAPSSTTRSLGFCRLQRAATHETGDATPPAAPRHRRRPPSSTPNPAPRRRGRPAIPRSSPRADPGGLGRRGSVVVPARPRRRPACYAGGRMAQTTRSSGVFRRRHPDRR